MASQNINLFQTKTTFQPVFALAEQYIKPITMVLLSILFTGSIMVGISFYVFGQQKTAMEGEKEQLLSDIKRQVSKESLLIMIRNRLTAVDKILETQISYSPYIDTTMKIIQSFTLSSFSMGDKNSVAISVNVTSLSEAVNVLKTLMEMEQRREITNPMLVSFTLNEQKIQIGLSYTVILKNL